MDTVIIPDHYAYQFRVDLSGNQQSTAEIKRFLDKYNFNKYHGMFEIGKKTGKAHYQMIIWRSAELSPYERTKCRNYWRGKTLLTKQPVSLTSARKLESLASYCQKGENTLKKGDYFQHISNLSKEEKELIPKWVTKKAKKLSKRDLFDSTLKSMIDPLQNWIEKKQFCEIINQAYYKVYQRPCLHRNTYITYLYKYGKIEDEDIYNHLFGGPHSII